MASMTWPLFFLCLILGAAFLAQWLPQRGRRQIVAATVFLVAAAAIFLADHFIITETKRVQANIYDLAKAVQAGNVERCLTFFSENDKPDRQLVGQAASMVEIQGPIRITDMAINMSSAESRAVASFRATADVKFQNQTNRYPTRWELTWQREGNDWKVIRVRRLQLIGDQETSPLAAAQ
jgi:ketosteroid isomerase-like protein